MDAAVKGILVFLAMSSLDEEGPDALVERFTPEQFEKYKELTDLETKDFEQYQDKYEESPIEECKFLVPGECETVTHYVVVESYYGSYTKNVVGKVTPIN